MDGRSTRISENQLVLDCAQKVLDMEHGGRIQIVRDDKDTLTALQDAVMPMPVKMISTSSKVPQRRLRNVLVTGEGEQEIMKGTATVAPGFVDASTAMNSFLGRKSAPVKEAAPVAEVPQSSKYTVPQVNSRDMRTFIEGLMQ